MHGSDPHSHPGREQEGAIRELAALRNVDPPATLVARVMTKIERSPSLSFWQWLRRPFRLELRISPLGAALLGVAVVAAAALIIAPRRPFGAASALNDARTRVDAPSSSPSAASAREQPILVRFVLEAPGAKQVAVVGSFNEWSADRLKLEDVDRSGLFVATVALPPGVHEYMFLVDGKWVTDPTTVERRPDGFGRQNSVLRL